MCVAQSLWQGHGMRSKELGNLHRFSLPGSFSWGGHGRRTENCHEGLPGFTQEVSGGVVARRRCLDLFGHTGSEPQEERERQQVNLETLSVIAHVTFDFLKVFFEIEKTMDRKQQCRSQCPIAFRSKSNHATSSP